MVRVIKQAVLSALIFFFCLSPSFSQSHTQFSDQELNQLSSLADSLFNTRSYQQLMKVLPDLKQAYASRNDWGNYLLFDVKLIGTLDRIQANDSTFYKIDQLRPQLSKIEGDSVRNMTEAYLYYMKGSLLTDKGNYQAAKSEFWKAVKLYEKEEELLGLASAYNELGVAHDFSYALDSALFYYTKSLEIRQEVLGLEHVNTLASIQNIGIVYELKGLTDQAEGFFVKALELSEKILEEDHPNLGIGYMNLGIFYHSSKNHHLATDYLIKGLLVLEKHREENQFTIAIAHFNLGQVYNNLYQFDESLYHYQKALGIYKALLGDNHVRVARVHQGLSSLFAKKGAYDLSLEHANKAVSILNTNRQETQVDLALAMRSIGGIYYKQKQLERAIDIFHESLDLFTKASGERNVQVAETYLNVANAYVEQNNLDSGLHYIQKALISNSLSFGGGDLKNNPQANDVIDNFLMINSLIHKVKAMMSEGSYESLEAAVLACLSADSVVEVSRRKAIDFQDQLYVNEPSNELYEVGIDVCIELINLAPDPDKIDLLFYFSEKNKSGILNDELLNKAAKRASIIPDSLLRLERYFKKEISYYQTRLNDSSADSLQAVIWGDRLFDFNRSQDTLRLFLEKNYPRYFTAKYQDTTVTIGEVQHELASDEAVIAYAFGQYKQAVLAISKEAYHLVPLQNIDSLEHYLVQFKKAIADPGEKTSNGYRQNYLQFSKNAHWLYQALFAPLEPFLKDQGIQSLSIVPDKSLANLPFEVLITSPASPNTLNYKDLDYLIHHYEFNYQYSTTLSVKRAERVTETAREFVGFAPSFEGVNERIGKQLSGKVAITPLKWNAQEVSSIHQIVREAEVYRNETATEANFKQQAPNTRVVHLATHAFVDEQDPMNSSIIFSSHEGAFEDGVLHAFEIYNLNFDSDMVTLSACNTGFGGMSKGEGTMSLARAFSYAGVPSVIMSHWEVDDKVTSRLMSLFYQNLNKGMRKDQALRQAKLQLIQENDPAISNPYFWGAFVVVGDVTPVSQTGHKTWYWLIAALSVALIVVFYSRLKSKNTPDL